MAKFFLSTLLLLLVSAGCHASVNDVSDEFYRPNGQVKELSEKRRLQNILFCCALVVMAVIGGLLYRIYRANRKIRSSNRHLYRNYVDMLDKEEQARERRKLDEQHIAELEARIRNMESASVVVSADNDPKDVAQKVKYQNSRMTGDDAKELYAAVLGVMENSDEIYKLGFNVDQLSELVHSRPHKPGVWLQLQFAA